METLFVLADIHDLSAIFTPLRTTQRIKYTCFTVSQNLLVFGASSGGLYVFRREPCSFLQLLPNQEGAIVHVAISPDEKLFAFASVKGIVCVLEKNSSGLGARRIFTSSEHLGVNVTSLQWNGQSNELFIGDQVGRVSVISLLPFMMKNMFNSPSCVVMVLDSRIVQMDWQGDLLLISTLSRSYVCDIAKERFRQIGVKPRDGEYGSCFFVCGDIPIKAQARSEVSGGSFTSVADGENIGDCEDLKCVKIYCARPGSRLWEVKVDGTVLNTHQFKQALAIPPTGLIKAPYSSDSSQDLENKVSKSTNNEDVHVKWNSQSFNFCKLFVLAKKYIFTFKRDGIYVFNPEEASVVMWSNDIVDIIDAQVLKDTIYLRTSSGQMYGVLFTPLDKFLIRLYLRKHYDLCAKLCEMHCQYLMKELPNSTKLYLLADLGTKLSNDEETEKILPLLQEISKCAEEIRNSRKLDSGIFVVENLHYLSKEDSETVISDFSKFRRAERFKDKSRSLSVSPERSRRRRKADISNKSKTQRSDSSSSLPELGKEKKKHTTKDGRVSLTVDDTDGKDKNEGHENRSFEKKKSFPKELFTSFESSPETIQTLKEIRQSVSSKITNSTKTLKEKWQVLEGKILRSETFPEPFDVRKADYIEKEEIVDQPDNCEEDISVTDNDRKKHLQPHIDISNVIITLKNIDLLEENDENFKSLIWKLCFELVIIFNQYMTAIKGFSEDKTLEDSSDLENDNPSIIMKYLLTEWTDTSFPFEDYFSSKSIEDISRRFHWALKNKILVEWLDELVPIMESEISVEALLVTYSRDVVRLDVLLSRILVVCSDLLDPQIILQCIKDSSIACYYYSFCVVLEKHQTGALQQVGKESSVENSCWQWPLPLRLNAMFFMLQMNQIETCCVMGNNIDLLDVWYLVLRLQMQQSKDNRTICYQSYFMFLNYLDRIADTETTMQNVLKNELLLLITTLAFENVNHNFGESCKCGFPFPVGCTTQVHFNEIGQILSNHLWLTNHDRHQQLCEKVPVLWKQMLRSTPSDNLKSVLPLLVQLGDFSVLEPLLPHITPEMWHQVLDMICTVNSGQCLKCGMQSLPKQVENGSHISEISALLVKHLGASSALELLSNHSVSSGYGTLEERFYKACIFAAIADSQCDDLRCEAIDLAIEKHRPSVQKPLVSSEFGKLLDEALAQDLAKVSVPAGEPDSRHHHWGTQVNLQSDPCPCCALPLGSSALLQDVGLMVFQCGHAFHSLCLRQKTSSAFSCLLCHPAS